MKYSLLFFLAAAGVCLPVKSFSVSKSVLGRYHGQQQVGSRRLTKQDQILGASLIPVDNEKELVSPGVSELNKNIVDFFKGCLMLLFKDRKRPYSYFYALETVARVPYFSYTSCLHLWETLGLRRRKELILMHFSESWNEHHHLLVMEELGGNEHFRDRFVAQHLAFFYYWIVIALYLSSPSTAYNFNFHIESHARETYDNFLREYQEELKGLPVPEAAKQYWGCSDLECTGGSEALMRATVDSASVGTWRNEAAFFSPAPKVSQMANLYDVFERIRDDEEEHAVMMLQLSRDPNLREWR